MKQIKALRVGMAALACLGMIIPGPLLEAANVGQRPRQTQPRPATAATDVSLNEGGVLLGQVVDANGRPFSGQTVSLYHRGREVATAVTDRSGRFQIRGIRGGIYEVACGPGRAVYRIWAPHTAPPTIGSGMLVVVAGDQVRGQGLCGPICGLLSNPLLVAGLVAAAIAIPVAIDHHRKPASP